MYLMLGEIRAWKTSREAVWSPRPEGMGTEEGAGVGRRRNWPEGSALVSQRVSSHRTIAGGSELIKLLSSQ